MVAGAGAVQGGAVGVVEDGVVHAAAKRSVAHTDAHRESRWSFRAHSFMMAASIASPLSYPVSMDLLWFLLEAGVALLLLLGIVWWTWPRGEKPPGDGES